MKKYVGLLTIAVLSMNLMGTNVFDCTVKKARSGYRAKDFESFVLTTWPNKINIVRIIEINDSEVGYDEQFYPHKNMRCNIPGEGGHIYTSCGLPEKSINAFRVASIAFGSNAPDIVNVGYALATYDNHIERCVPAIYECIKRRN